MAAERHIDGILALSKLEELDKKGGGTKDLLIHDVLRTLDTEGSRYFLELQYH